MKLIIILTLLFFVSLVPINIFADTNPTGGEYDTIQEDRLPIVKNSKYIVEEYITGLKWPTTMTFVNDDILILEKNSGNVRLVKNGVLQSEPVFRFNVSYLAEMGLLRIISSDSTVYFYLTERDPNSNEILGNHIYKSEWNGENLINLSLVKKLPVGERGVHNAGVFAKGNDGTIYSIIGDVDQKGILQNYHQGESNDSSVIFNVNSKDEYYAIGIRNSFGLAVDPITGEIWDSENNDKIFDEINLVEYKFNSGWDPIIGPSNPETVENLPQFMDFKYSDPEFSWELTVSPTALSFVPESSLMQNNDSLFVGDFLNGFLYEFKLNSDRTGFIFESSELTDLVVNGGDLVDEIIFGTGFGGITDIEFGPDGLMYIVSIMDGKIYRILPNPNIEILENEKNCFSIPKPRINLSGCDLSNRDFSNADLAFADLSNTIIEDTNFEGTRMTGSNMENSEIYNSNFKNSNLVNVNLSNTKIINSNFEKSEIRYTGFKNSNILESNFTKSIIRGSNFEDAILNKSSFIDSTLYHSNLINSKIINSEFINTNMKFSKFNNSTYEKNLLKDVDMSHAKMIGMKINNTNINNSITVYVDFSDTVISNSNFVEVYPYSTTFLNTKILNTVSDTCFDDSILSKAVNKILREIRSSNLEILKPFELIFIKLCN